MSKRDKVTPDNLQHLKATSYINTEPSGHSLIQKANYFALYAMCNPFRGCTVINVNKTCAVNTLTLYAVEFMLKAILERKNGEFEKTHDLDKLHKAAESEIVEIFNEKDQLQLKEFIDVLNPTWIDNRATIYSGDRNVLEFEGIAYMVAKYSEWIIEGQV